MSEPFTFSTADPHLDSRLGQAILVAFATGLYTVVFSQGIALIIRERRKLLALVLTLLFSLNLINLAVAWVKIRYVFVLRNGLLAEMYTAFLGYQLPEVIGDIAMVLTVLLSDLVLVWRCCILWPGNRWMIWSYALIFLAQIVLIPLYLIQTLIDTHIGPPISFFCLYLFVSVVTTLSATSLIIYRIKSLSGAGKYFYIIEALIQSGAIYSLSNVTTASLLAAREINPSKPALIQVTTYEGGFLTPLAGIITTWMSTQLIAQQEKEKRKATTALSVLRFQPPIPPSMETQQLSASSPVEQQSDCAPGPSYDILLVVTPNTK